jgi:major membrane immunogen (membrane-anchored lipoprotein)
MKIFSSLSLSASTTILAIFALFSPYRDGNYTGRSQAQYTREPYVGKVDLCIEKGKIIKVSFTITDTSLNEIFDDKYERHFVGNNLYIQQCRDDWKGVKFYPAKLLETQDIDKVDAVTGATWSYNIFKASVKEALDKQQ